MIIIYGSIPGSGGTYRVTPGCLAETTMCP